MAAFAIKIMASTTEMVVAIVMSSGINQNTFNDMMIANPTTVPRIVAVYIQPNARFDNFSMY